jgi:hypothetical protein
MNLRRSFLYTVLASLAIAACIGIAALLFGIAEEERPIFSMLSIALFSLLSLWAASAIEKRTWIRVMRFNIIFCILGAFLFLFAIWMPLALDGDFLPKTMGLTATWTITLTIAGLLAITRFNPPLNLLRTFSIAMVFILAIIITLYICFEPDDDLWGRLTGVDAILTALGAIGLPILYKAKGIKPPIETSPLELSITCPRCLLPQSIPAGDSRCTRCRLKFHLELEEPRCPECNYLLYRLTSPRCPECGHPLAPDDLPLPPLSLPPSSTL